VALDNPVVRDLKQNSILTICCRIQVLAVVDFLKPCQAPNTYPQVQRESRYFINYTCEIFVQQMIDSRLTLLRLFRLPIPLPTLL
jgi:hypothetical protein